MRGGYFGAVLILILFLCAVPLAAQSTKTIILVRHAEKDTSATADPGDPVLTSEGVSRSKRLEERNKRFKPAEIYSTNFKRTRDTVTPLAKKRNKEIQVYDAKKPQELADKIVASKTKRFLIVGHSN